MARGRQDKGAHRRTWPAECPWASEKQVRDTPLPASSAEPSGRWAGCCLGGGRTRPQRGNWRPPAPPGAPSVQGPQPFLDPHCVTHTGQGAQEEETGTGLGQAESTLSDPLGSPMSLGEAVDSSHSGPQSSYLCKGPNCRISWGPWEGEWSNTGQGSSEMQSLGRKYRPASVREMLTPARVTAGAVTWSVRGGDVKEVP